MPIVDWNLKRDVMKDEFGEDTYKGVFFHALIVKTDAERYHAFMEAAKKWDESSPSQAYHPEIANLCKRLFGQGLREDVQFFIDSDIGQFKERIVMARTGTPSPPLNEWTADSHHVLIALDEERSHSIRSSMRSRRLDQRLYYMNIDSADVWHELINVGSYKMYDWCRESLRALMRSQVWKVAIADNKLETLVMLGGGGSASKDFEVTNALADMNYRANQPTKTRYILVDISPHMLMSSMSRIKRHVRRQPKTNQLFTVEAYVADMLRLGELKKCLRTEGGRNAWFLTGGTIGNFNERKLVTSLESIALPGDLLAIGVDTHDPSRTDESASVLKEKYHRESMQDFLQTPLSILANNLDLDVSVKRLRERLKVEVVEGRKHGYSDVDDTATVEVSLDIGDGDSYTLLTSTRYQLDSFIGWFQVRGWKAIGQFASADTSATFRQVLFEKMNTR